MRRFLLLASGCIFILSLNSFSQSQRLAILSQSISTIKGDSNIIQPGIIFQTWGSQITQQQFSNVAKSMAILQQNGRLTINNNQLTDASKKSCEYIASTIDFTIFPDTVFNTLVMANWFVLDANNDLTPSSRKKLEQAYYYKNGLDEAQALNLLSKDSSAYNGTATLTKWEHMLAASYIPAKALANNESMLDVIELGLKDEFYQNSYRLTDVSKANKNIKDTTINGQRYVLMVAWKSKSFENYIIRINTVSTFKSDNEFFKYPLFLATQYDMSQFCIKNNLTTADTSVSRPRLMQLLGLPPGSGNDYFVEFWVGENDLFRPAIDSSLKSTQLLTHISPGYIYAQGSYSANNILSEYPFTALGYTWDCNPANTTHFGVSEFVLRENRLTYIRSITPTKDYLARMK
jgi:hypothetical protein